MNNNEDINELKAYQFSFDDSNIQLEKHDITVSEKLEAGSKVYIKDCPFIHEIVGDGEEADADYILKREEEEGYFLANQEDIEKVVTESEDIRRSK